MNRYALKPIIGGYHMTTVTGTAQTILQLTGLTRFPEEANGCLVQIDHTNELDNDDLAVRYREDGTAPDANNGICMENGSLREFADIDQMRNAKFISIDSGNVKMSVQFYKGN